MKIRYVVIALLLTVVPIVAFTQNKLVYNPNADAKSDIESAIKQAQQENKHVFLQIGGNWCPWCIKFHQFIEADEELKTQMNNSYVVVKVNYDRDNRQEDLLRKLEYPQRFGFPVFVVLDETGKRIHTQNSAYLEKEKSYDKKTVMGFFKNWSPTAIDPASY